MLFLDCMHIGSSLENSSIFTGAFLYLFRLVVVLNRMVTNPGYGDKTLSCEYQKFESVSVKTASSKQSRKRFSSFCKFYYIPV